MTLYEQHAAMSVDRDDVHRWVFAHDMNPGVEFTVRKWLSQRLDSFYCDLQTMYTPHRMSRARVHIASLSVHGLNPYLLVCGWPFCLDDVDGKGGTA